MRSVGLIALCGLLTACQASPEPEVRRSAPASAALVTSPVDATACWARDRIPALTQTQFETGPDGARVPREVVLRPAEDRLFTVPCDTEMDADFIAALQRALAARGHYAGAISGVYDAATAGGVRLYQAPLGLESGVLSLDAARMMGLVAIGRAGL